MRSADDAVSTLPTKKEPGMLTVLADMVKDGIGCASVGMVLGAVAAVVTSLIVGDTTSFFEGIGLNFGYSALNGAALGAIAGAALGVPEGCARGIKEIKSYYRDIAIPQIKEAELSKGKILGAQMEQTAAALEQESQRFRNAITQRGNYTEAASLINMEPMGRA